MDFFIIFTSYLGSLNTFVVWSIQTSNIIDAEELKEDVTNAAEAAGLEVDTAALEILSSSASNDNSVFAEIADNIDSEKYDWDKMPTFDADTMVFKDSSWNDLVKVNGVSSVNGLSYTSNNNFFDGTAGSQQGRGATFVNVAKGEISAKFYLRIKHYLIVKGMNCDCN